VTQKNMLVGTRRIVSLYLLISLILLAAFALRMWHLNTESVWHDEGWSIRAITGVMPDDNTPPFYYATASLLWRMGAGESPLALRYTSVLLSVVGVAFALKIGWRWYGFTVGLAGGALTAFSPLLWSYAHEIRAYIAVPLIALLVLYGAENLLRHKSPLWRNWALIFGAEIIGLYTHNLVVPLIVWLNIALGILWLLQRQWRRMIVWAGLQITLIVLYIPWLLTQSPSGTALNTPPQIGFGLLRDIWYSYFLPVLPQLRNSGNNLLINGLGLALILGAIALIFEPQRREDHKAFNRKTAQHSALSTHHFLLISHVLMIPCLTTALLLAAHIDFHPRYYIAAVPGTLILLAAGVNVIAKRAARIAPPLHLLERGLGGEVALVVLAGLTSIASLHQITTTRTYQHDDFAGLAAYYATLPPDAVILLPFPTEPALQVYFAKQLSIQARFVNMPLYADENTVLQELDQLFASGTRQVEFLTWFQLPADSRGMYPCLLTGISAEVHPAQDFFGLRTQAFMLEARPEMRSLAFTPVYGEMMLQSAAYMPSRSGVCLRTAWSLIQPPMQNVSVAADLVDQLSDSLARDDAMIARPDQVGTAEWNQDDIGEAYNLLSLPEGAPLLYYDLTLNLYNAAQPSGFDLLNLSGEPAGKTYNAAESIQAAGPPLQNPPTIPVVQSDTAGEDGIIRTGLPFDVTVMLPGLSDTTVEVVLEGDGWTLQQIALESGMPTLTWHRFIVPPGNSGEAILRVDSTQIARYTVVDVPRIFEPPVFDVPVDMTFPTIGTLVGVSAQTALSSDNPPEVTLIWQAEAATETAYTVFVQLIAADGRLLAQSDAQPVSGTRPTTGWVTGEYLTDVHTLTWNITDYSGDAYLIAGFYDAANNFQRVPAADGTDHARLPLEISVE